MNPPRTPLPAGHRIAHFEVQRVLGRGSMGTVYAARDLTLHRPVALKVLDADTFGTAGSKGRLLGEARSAARLNHPNIVSVYEFGEEKGAAYLALELVEGETLDKIRARVRKVTPRDAVDLALQAVAGLSHAAAQGTIHRDVKPENLILGRDGRLRLLDFGLARAVDRPSLSEDGLVLGTPDYMSPEQAMGAAVDFAADVYALGVVLFELLSGELPFPGRSTIEVLRRRTVESAPPIEKRVPGLPPSLVRAVGRCLEREPRRRYPSYDALGADLLEALAVVPDRSVLPSADTHSSSRDISLAALRGAQEVAAGQDRDPARTQPVEPLAPPFPAPDRPRVASLPAFVMNPLRAFGGLAAGPEPRPEEALRVWGELALLGWGIGLVLGGRLYPVPGPVDGLLMLGAFGTAIKLANLARGGVLSWAKAMALGAWCGSPCVLAGLAPLLTGGAALGLLVLALRFALGAEAPGVAPGGDGAPEGAPGSARTVIGASPVAPPVPAGRGPPGGHRT